MPECTGSYRAQSTMQRAKSKVLTSTISPASIGADPIIAQRIHTQELVAQPLTASAETNEPVVTSPAAVPLGGLKSASPTSIYSLYSRNQKLGLLLLVCTCCLIVPMTDTIYLPALERVKQDLQCSQAMAALSVAVYMLGAGIMALIWGPFAGMLLGAHVGRSHLNCKEAMQLAIHHQAPWHYNSSAPCATAEKTTQAIRSLCQLADFQNSSATVMTIMPATCPLPAACCNRPLWPQVLLLGLQQQLHCSYYCLYIRTQHSTVGGFQSFAGWFSDWLHGWWCGDCG